METIQRELPEGLEDRLRKAVRLLQEASRVRILSHYDGDGTAAAALLTVAMMREGLDVHTTLSHHLDAEKAKTLTSDGMDLLLVSDMGSAQVDLLEGLGTPVVVLDHHQPLRDSDEVVQVNPHFFGMSGTRDGCGSTSSFLLAMALDDANLDLAGIALVGCIADRQHIGGFKGINKLLFDRALEEGILQAERGLALPDLPLREALLYSVGPYLKGLSGREDRVKEFLAELRVDGSQRFRELGEDQRESLLSTLTMWLLRQGARPETVQQLVEDRYWYPAYEMYVDDLEACVNACSRRGEESLGLALSLGDFSQRERAEELRRKHWKDLLRGLMRIEEDGVFSRDFIQFFYADGPTLAGSVAGVAMRYLLDQRKPTLALALMDGKTKVSARATDYLVGKGVDLAEALREGATAVGGSGGGHNIASGATIPKGKEERFLEVVDTVVARQLSASQA